MKESEEIRFLEEKGVKKEGILGKVGRINQMWKWKAHGVFFRC